jgi:hypothetical protein
MVGVSSLDAYTIRARLLPAIIAAAPGLALAGIFVSWDNFGLSTLIVSLAALALLIIFADLARRQGRRIEPRVYRKIGGKPSTLMLRHSDNTLDAETRSRYRAFLAGKLKERSPTADDETARPKECDGFYERCGDWLREQTRDQKKFKLLFEENMTYGFRRNLLGLKPLGLALNACVVFIAILSLAFRFPLDSENELATRLISTLAFAAIHAIYFSAFVSMDGVCEAAQQYARQLLLSCESLSTPSTAEPKKRTNAAKITP